MIPVLYDSTYTDVDGLTNGLGALYDTVSCIVTEERNGAYTLTMKYPVNGQHYDDIGISKLIKVVPFDGGDNQFFRICKISKPFNGIVTIYAQHITYQLTNIPVAPFTASSVTAALAALSTYSVEDNPFTFWTDKSTTATYTQTVPESIRARLGGQSGSILSVYGGEYEWDNYTVKLHASRGSDSGVTLRYGKNITDIKQEENIQNTYTGIYPYYYTDDEGLLELTEKVLYADTAGNYPYNRTKTIDFTDKFDEMPTEDELREVAQDYIDDNDIGYPSVSIDVSFVALWQTEEYADIAPLERVNLCDTVTVEFEKLGISTSAKVIKTEYDVLLERYTKIELGDAKSSLATTITDINTNTNEKIDTASSRLAAAIEHATELLRGGLGGYVVINTNASGQPNELLIMDTDDIDTATNVWRWNLNGLGFSSTGYDGTYGTAITQDGQIVADFITTGALNAGIVTTGVLTDAEGLNSWDLDTGEFSLNATSTLDGTTVSDLLTDVSDNADAITDETTRATTAESTLSSSITANSSAITAEVTRATGVEETLSDDIEAEETRATTAEETLQGSITVNANAITAEVTRATGVEETLSSAITVNANAITSKVSQGDVSSEISQESDTITISGDRFILNSTNCSITADGTITATSAVLDDVTLTNQNSSTLYGVELDSDSINFSYNGTEHASVQYLYDTFEYQSGTSWYTSTYYMLKLLCDNILMLKSNAGSGAQVQIGGYNKGSIILDATGGIYLKDTNQNFEGQLTQLSDMITDFELSISPTDYINVVDDIWYDGDYVSWSITSIASDYGVSISSVERGSYLCV